MVIFLAASFITDKKQKHKCSSVSNGQTRCGAQVMEKSFSNSGMKYWHMPEQKTLHPVVERNRAQIAILCTTLSLK